MLILLYYYLHFALLRDAELLLLLREAPLLDDLDTEALLLLAELLRETLLFDALLRELLNDTEGLFLLELLLLRDSLLFDTLLLFEALLLLREPVTEAEPLRESLDELLRATLEFEETLREKVLGVIAVRWLSSESTFTTRLSL